jgi:hypothetical protein
VALARTTPYAFPPSACRLGTVRREAALPVEFRIEGEPLAPGVVLAYVSGLAQSSQPQILEAA